MKSLIFHFISQVLLTVNLNKIVIKQIFFQQKKISIVKKAFLQFMTIEFMKLII